MSMRGEVLRKDMVRAGWIRGWSYSDGIGWTTRGGLHVTLDRRRPTFRVAGAGKIRSFETVWAVLRFVGEQPVREWPDPVNRPRSRGHALRAQPDRLEELA